MALQKLVNGERIDLTPEEEAAFIAESNVNELLIIRERKLAEIDRRVYAAMINRYLRDYDTTLGTTVQSLRTQIQNANTVAELRAIDETSVPDSNK